MTVYTSSLANPTLAAIADHLTLAADRNEHLPRFLTDTVTITQERKRYTFVTQAQMQVWVDAGWIFLVGEPEPAGEFERRHAVAGTAAVIVEYPAGGEG